jgi:hypothetical protein
VRACACERAALDSRVVRWSGGEKRQAQTLTAVLPLPAPVLLLTL